MKFLIVVLVALMSVAWADDKCDTLTRLKFKSQWNRAYSSGHNREDFSEALWRAIFAQAPSARDKFKRVHGEDTSHPAFKAHSLRVLAGFDIAINLLDQPEALKAELDHLEEQHKGRSIPDNYFDAFETALLHVAPAQLGRCWDKEAWKECTDVIIHGIEGH